MKAAHTFSLCLLYLTFQFTLYDGKKSNILYGNGSDSFGLNGPLLGKEVIFFYLTER